ncbi:MAG: FkbM family methyltransferase [Oscillospiraceae bacterium]|jgi:FkbM family methyltransferase|nr:FkbM family methyltransferase [Oscillospiraceae bacterium]
MFQETFSLWSYLAGNDKPIILYGMGDGADKIAEVLEMYGLPLSGVCASDSFVRGQSFRGFTVTTIDDMFADFPDPIVLLAFGTNKPEVLDDIYELSTQCEFYVPDLPVVGGGIWNEDYIERNIRRIERVRGLLADEWSQFLFDCIIDFRLSGVLDYVRNSYSDKYEMLSLLQLDPDGAESYLDLGAFDGDTVQDFLEMTSGEFHRITAVEPDMKNFMKLRRRFYQLGLDKFFAFNAAVSDHDGTTDFFAAGGKHGKISDSGRTREIYCRSILSLCEDDTPTYIKMDIEGAEEAAILGGAELIRNAKPKLMVAVYHRCDDLLRIPELLHDLNPDYKFYLRKTESLPGWDLNLVAMSSVPDTR